ncbi:unnamed protein product [Effrenium voratum]|uniref:Ion transport domain-containing protein n=1 Tax=Effrenium voratum TaxID=2562239 RepID=A0AA36IXM1_9DINO|nr:unnamed protein product [Effrenium voratum]CAJ1395823.1 unnamed protein product [Effrenium voratum]CAJ1417746.1 unnamed protein product [Effrenium voratum]
MTFGDTPFHRHLMALSAEYERVVIENMELRKELQDDGTLWRLGRQEEPPPPLQPMTAYLATESTALACDLPGVVDGSNCKMLPAYPSSPTRAAMKRQNSRLSPAKPPGDAETEAGSMFLLLLDVVPALVILLSAAVAGLSADIEPDHDIWKVFEISFTVFFIGEIIVKFRVFGRRDFLCGSDWYWSWFDILCVILALIDMGITYGNMAARKPGEPVAENSAAGTLGTLKMLKLARLGRIVRLLKFKIFQELKLMIQGVFTGLRVLFWAVVLLVGCMYLLGVVTRTLFSAHQEFASVPAAMFTSFRCFTDGCSAYDGTPLQERLRQTSELGGFFMFAYILLFLFVTIGIFNLIMAVFIDNVTDGSTKKRQRQLGQNQPKTEWVIANTLRHIILTNIVRKEAEEELALAEKTGADGSRRVSRALEERLQALQEMYGYQPHSTEEYADLTDKIRIEMAEKDIVVTKEEFNRWLSTEMEFLSKLDDAEVDLSCKFDLFDVLDADLSGELEFEEMVDGLLKCRGPASKTDIIAIRLKTALLVRMMTKMCEKLGIEAF